MTPIRRYRGQGRVAFLAARNEIEAALDQGWPLTAIYDRHGAGMGITYGQFARYVRRYLRAGDPAPVVRDAPPRPRPPVDCPARENAAGAPSFRFDPEAGDLDDFV